MISDDAMYVRFETNHRLQWQGFKATLCACKYTK